MFKGRQYLFILFLALMILFISASVFAQDAGPVVPPVPVPAVPSATDTWFASNWPLVGFVATTVVAALLRALAGWTSGATTNPRLYGVHKMLAAITFDVGGFVDGLRWLLSGSAAGVPPAPGSIVRKVGGLGVLLLAFWLTGCLTPKTPLQQVQDVSAEWVCVSNDWGKPIATIALDCTGDTIAVVEDLIADIELALGVVAMPTALAAKAPIYSSSPYANMPNIQALVLSKSGHTLLPLSMKPAAAVK